MKTECRTLQRVQKTQAEVAKQQPSGRPCTFCKSPDTLRRGADDSLSPTNPGATNARETSRTQEHPSRPGEGTALGYLPVYPKTAVKPIRDMDWTKDYDNLTQGMPDSIIAELRHNYLPVTVGRSVTLAKLDSGADINAISSRVIDILPDSVKRRFCPRRETVNCANGGDAQVTGT